MLRVRPYESKTNKQKQNTEEKSEISETTSWDVQPTKADGELWVTTRLWGTVSPTGSYPRAGLLGRLWVWRGQRRGRQGPLETERLTPHRAQTWTYVIIEHRQRRLGFALENKGRG